MKDHYVVQVGEKQYAYFLPKPSSVGHGEKRQMLADETAMEHIEGNWYLADHQASSIIEVVSNGSRTVGYELRDPATESARFPQTLSTEEYSERSSEHDIYYDLYRAVTEPRPTTRTEHAGPWLLLVSDLGLDHQVQAAWVADLPTVLKERAEYRHLFPGYLSGFQDAVKAKLEHLPNIAHVFKPGTGDDPQKMTVTISLAWEQPRTSAHAKYGVRGQKLRGTRLVEQKATQKFLLDVPWVIKGANRAEAEQVWLKTMDELVESVNFSGAVACPECNGHGAVLRSK